MQYITQSRWQHSFWVKPNSPHAPPRRFIIQIFIFIINLSHVGISHNISNGVSFSTYVNTKRIKVYLEMPKYSHFKICVACACLLITFGMRQSWWISDKLKSLNHINNFHLWLKFNLCIVILPHKAASWSDGGICTRTIYSIVHYSLVNIFGC